MANWATERLNELVRGTDVVLPPVTKTLRLGTIDSWAPGLIKKTWLPHPELLNVDGSMFGGYIAALADQALTLAAMTRVPDDLVFRTLNLSVNFLRVGKAEPLAIEARVTAQTRQVISTRAEFRRPDNELIAEASAQQFLLAMR
ncbi:PaaI family thioesterase [Bradyrhizobium sp. LHD-71]|uniref:PaaI family thioesterase n=1 Tax=Bradyrhizobium sp. LHD-71 TaxID=3072141 RepID=UPI0028100A56|nr:PaaI family thioesterase [Bradyrhizobium sp. LHD-71]MDQ8727610.1 PaaI family thioesterase [Bradyrhizobium sp. LHD-71]